MLHLVPFASRGRVTYIRSRVPSLQCGMCMEDLKSGMKRFFASSERAKPWANAILHEVEVHSAI